MTDLVEAWAFKDTAVFLWDQRGHGRSDGMRGYAPNMATLIKDADRFVAHISASHNIPTENMMVLGHSVGAVIAAAWVHDFAPPVRGMILATPAFRIKLYVPFALASTRALVALKPDAFIKSYVRPSVLTHDKHEAKRYATDPLVFREIAAPLLVDLFDTSKRVVEDAGAIDVPTLVLSADADWVVHKRDQVRFFENLSSDIKSFENLDGFYHAIFHDAGRDKAVKKCQAFIERRFASPVSARTRADADKSGFTRTEYDGLIRPLPALSLKRLWFGAQSLLMKTLGRLSQGVRLGWRTGFDSGQSLNYVYQNEARGITPLGKLIDRNYLDAIGWRGIRQRGQILERLILDEIKHTAASERPVTLIDIAAGPGRYLLQTIKKAKDVDVTAVLSDNVRANLAVGEEIAREHRLDNVHFVQGDAFDPKSIRALAERPTIAIVSGLYELFPDNAPLKRSLKGLFDALDDGATLIYTNQPWHPQVEMIARVLTNREGVPWIMRRRTQGEMDDLVRAAGFEKTSMEIDDFGIFTVSVARKPASATVEADVKQPIRATA